MQKKETKTTRFFNECVEVYFQFFEKKFGLKPSFDGSSPRDLKTILEAMEKRSEENKVEWSVNIATRMFGTFLEFSYQEKWLQENFFLFNLNRQKDKIFFKIKSQIDGTSKSGFTREGVNAEFDRRNYANREAGCSED